MALPTNLTYLTAKELHQAWWIALRKESAWEKKKVTAEFRRRNIPLPRRKS